jgi:hypothetical protein
MTWQDKLRAIPTERDRCQGTAVCDAADALGIEPLLIVEVGVYKGHSSRIFASRFPRATLVLIDPWAASDFDSRIYRGKEQEDWDKIHDDICAEFAHKHIVFRGTSEEFDCCVKPDIIFIDGDHTYDGVRRDILHWLPYCDHTLLCGHDYTRTRKHRGVKQAVDELLGEVVIGNRKTWFRWIGGR